MTTNDSGASARDDDQAARKARAASIHDQISKLKAQQKGASEASDEETEEADAGSNRPRSPRDLIHEKMRELRDKESQ